MKQNTCSPICDGEINVYSVQTKSEYRNTMYDKEKIYVCSKGEKSCPIINLKMKIEDTLSWRRNIMSQDEFDEYLIVNGATIM